jgi:hypothetical protein
MFQFSRFAILAMIALLSCSEKVKAPEVSKEQIQAVLEAHPEILFQVLTKHREKLQELLPPRAKSRNDDRDDNDGDDEDSDDDD